MKKLKLKIQELLKPEVLTRQQLKNVLGGDGTVTLLPCATGVEFKCQVPNRGWVTEPMNSCAAVPNYFLEYCKSYFPDATGWDCKCVKTEPID